MAENKKEVFVWDLFIRFFHWTLAGAVLGMYLTGEHYKTVHIRLGYFIVCLVLVRILWGFVGTEHARFKNFLHPPGTIYQYLVSLIKRNPKHYLGHNPAGGIMIVVVLGALLATAFAGLKTYGLEGHGPFAHSKGIAVKTASADQDDDHADGHRMGFNKKAHKVWEELHEFMTGVMIFLIIVHVSGVVVSSWAHRENLVLAMFSGKKRIE